MSEPAELEPRIADLEIRIAYQDETIEDLNKTVVEQWGHIDRLSRLVTALIDRIQELENARSLGNPPEPPPPHY
ncbi:SlyX family protein [Rhodoligotrophos ferricapiens]|uniref:SlyX family protein n=1 Tax=Rhodoligotrophos ferricapiens TaxID=3069264 RepID=UPI00315DECDB